MPAKDKVFGDSSIPGPGQYDVKSRVGGEGPSYGIRGRHQDPQGDQKPGPGNYNPRDDITKYATPGTKMGSGQRDGLVKGNDMPGPGNYDLSNNYHKGKEISFGQGKRDNSMEKQTRGNPGPGTYKSSSFMGKDTQGKTIAGRVKDMK